ncbi:MAG: gamma-glutamyltransferase [Planctomycetes bacterium]|nr:gamma-glutamyltransferase [Planctomycetota bacterium]
MNRSCLGNYLVATGVVFSSLGVMPCATRADGPTRGHSATGTRGMVVAVSRPAAEVGLDVLKKGGNAVDAAVATAFALAVTWPEAGNLGGGGFMLVHPGGKEEPVVIDYRETAPAAATRRMFDSDRPPSPYKVVGVPGTVRGLSLAHRRFGKLSWKDVVLPAVRLAEDGFLVDAPLATSLNRELRRSKNFPELVKVYGKDRGRKVWQDGDRLVLKDLGRTLRRIAEEGPDAFYSGLTADLIDAEMKRGGGLITKTDLAGYRAKVRRPVHGTYRDFDVYAPPPPSSGGIALVEMLNILEHFDLRRDGRWSARTLHLTVEAMRRAYLDRARYLGDPDLVRIPDRLTTKEYARTLAKDIDLRKATPSTSLAKDIPLSGEGEQTTHFSVIDGNGMAVANTYTLEASFGSRVVVRGGGFLLNNEMDDFNPRPGVTNRKGLIGTPANEVAPGKRMLSSMTPTIVTRNGRVYLITGSPGGRTIINTVCGVVLNVLEFEMSVRDAVDAPRLHHQWLPDVIRVEAALAREQARTLEKLREMGHAIERTSATQGDAHSIRVDPRTGPYEGAADRRRGGWAAGY